MLIPLSIVDDVAIVDLGQQHHRHNNMLPVYVLFDSRTGNISQNHRSRTPPWSVIDQALLFHSHYHNNVPTRLMSHNHNVSSRLTSQTVSVVDETVVYDSPRGNNFPRRSRIHPHHHHHHHNGPRASPPVQNARASPVVMGVQDTSQHVTKSTTDAESVCCICLVDLSNGSSTPTRLRCSHVFHTDCIQKWINIKKTCPLCRANV
ncbi:unnamed protein product [Lathyrus sativus]|nr:unnamed protein product [Lathyrus sativus]